MLAARYVTHMNTQLPGGICYASLEVGWYSTYQPTSTRAWPYHPGSDFENSCPHASFLAHLSQRLIGELIGYSWSGVRPSSVRRPSVVRLSLTISNFFSETAWPIKAKFYVEPPWVGGTKVCSRHLSHMTKMAATPIYGKNPSKISFSRTGRPIFTKLGV